MEPWRGESLSPWREVCKIKTVFIRIWGYYLSLTPCCHLHCGKNGGSVGEWKPERGHHTSTVNSWPCSLTMPSVSDLGEWLAFSCVRWHECKILQLLWKAFRRFLVCLNIHLSCVLISEDTFSLKDLYKSYYGSFARNQKLATTQILLLRRK